MGRPVVLDLFCGAGGAAAGYHWAGYDVKGVDNVQQPHYPFPFHLGDAIDFLAKYGDNYDLIHASPPCQAFSPLNAIHRKYYPNLIEPVRQILRDSGYRYVIENVPGSPLIDPIILCGRMFDLPIYRHRYFEISEYVDTPSHPPHTGNATGTKGRYHTGTIITVAGHNGTVRQFRDAMEMQWATGKEIAQAVPPAYTEYIGTQLLNHSERTETA